METNTLQVIEADVFIGNVSRKITLTRREGQSCYWAETPVICRFPTGTKLHTKNYAMVVERSGRFEVARRQVVANKTATPVGWSGDIAVTSKWRREQ